MLIKNLIKSKKSLSQSKNLIPLIALEKNVKKELKKGNENYIPYILSELSIRALTHIEELKTIQEYIDRIIEIQNEHCSEIIENVNSKIKFEDLTKSLENINSEISKVL